MPGRDLLVVRAALGTAAVLSLRDAARLLPVRESEARQWLRDSGCVRVFLGAEIVVWGDVLRALPPTAAAGSADATLRSRPPPPVRRVPLPPVPTRQRKGGAP